jgi:hypothetical protein
MTRHNLCEVLLYLDNNEVYSAYGDLLVRLGNAKLPDKEEGKLQVIPDSSRFPGTVIEYMDGYW